MIELRAVDYVESQAAAMGNAEECGRPLDSGKHRKAWARGSATFCIEGDRPVDGFVFDSPDLSLICRGDLLAREGTSGANLNQSPAENLANLYLRHGDDFVSRLCGTFAIIAFDHRTRTLKAWTDQFGAERIVYTKVPGFVAAATDLRLITQLSHSRFEIDSRAILEYVQYTCIPAPRTIYRGVFRLEPGHQLTAGREMATRKYWDMAFAEVDGKPEAHWAKETLEQVRAAVSRHVTGLDNIDTLGCFLSGGTDSSSIASLFGRITGKAPQTFSIGFDHPSYNEMQYARIAATSCNARHHEYFVKPDDILAVLNKAAGVYDEPFGNSSVIPTYFCARLASDHGITHMLAGDGGDELFGGNSRYVDDRVFQRYELLPPWLRRGLVEPLVETAAARIHHRVFRRAASYVNRARIELPDRIYSYSLLSSVPAAELFSRGLLDLLRDYHPLSVSRRHFAASGAESDLNRWLYLDLKITINDNDLRKVTPMSRSAGITTRYPLLDPGLAEFTGTIPSSLKVRGGQLRYLFKRAMSDVLPQAIIKKSKHGFGLPYSVWVGEHKPLRDFTFDVLGSTSCRERGYFRRDILEWLWSRYETVHRTYYGDLLWVFLMLELWHAGQFDSREVSPEVVPASHVLN